MSLARASTRRPGAGRRMAVAVTLLAGAPWVAAGGAARAETDVLHVVIDHEGLAGLHRVEGGRQVMRLPQFRLFDAAGQPLWSFTGLPRGFDRELDRRLTAPRKTPVEGRTFGQEARYFLRRGGLPLNLTTLPETDLTVVEYWSGDCRVSKRLSREVDRYFARRPEASVKIVRVLVDPG